MKAIDKKLMWQDRINLIQEDNEDLEDNGLLQVWKPEEKESGILRTPAYHFILHMMLELSADQDLPSDAECAYTVVMSTLCYVSKSYRAFPNENEQMSPCADIMYSIAKKYRNIERPRNMYRVQTDIQKMMFEVGYERCGLAPIKPFAEWLRYYGYTFEQLQKIVADCPSSSQDT